MQGRSTFLVAEDDAAVGRTLVRQLKRHGRAQVVKTYRAARKALEANAYTAVVIDVGLPDGSGLDLVAAARARDTTLPILVVSGAVDAWRLAEAHALGAHFLLKPVEPEQLELFVARAEARPELSERRVRDYVARWGGQYLLTPAETELLAMCALGTPRGELHVARDVEPSTVKKQVQNMLAKTGDASLDVAVGRLLRELLSQS